MKTFEISGTVRTEQGKNAVKKIRTAGFVPCVLYGSGEPQNFKLDKIQLKKLLYNQDTFLVKLTIDGTSVDAVIREAQFHPVTDEMLHVDFQRVIDGSPVTLTLPLQLTGTASGVIAGGKLLPLIRKVKVRGEVKSLPDAVTVDISSLELGKTLKISEVTFEGYQVLTPGQAGIAVVEVPRSLKA